MIGPTVHGPTITGPTLPVERRKPDIYRHAVGGVPTSYAINQLAAQNKRFHDAEMARAAMSPKDWLEAHFERDLLTRTWRGSDGSIITDRMLREMEPK